MLTRRGAGLLLGFILLLASFIAGPAAVPALAAEIRSEDTVVIAADEVIDDDLVVNGNVIQIDGTVLGDLVANGSTVVVNGNVEGSAILAGQSLQINGTVGGSVYAGSFDLTLGETALIGRNLYYGGFGLTLLPGSQVERSVYAGTSQVVADGSIGGDLVIGSNALELAGSVGGDVRGEVAAQDASIPPSVFFPNMPGTVESIGPGLRIDPAAAVGGEIRVEETDPAEMDVADGTGFLGLPNWLLDRVGEFIGLVLIAAILIYLVPRFLPAIAGELAERPWPSLGWGALLMLVLLPVAIVAGGLSVVLLTVLFGLLTFGELVGAVLTLSGSFLAFALFAFLFVAYLIAKIVVAYLVGRWILTRAGMEPSSRWVHLGYVALGALIYEILRAIPVAGWLLSLLVSLFGVGAIVSYWLTTRRKGEVPGTKLETGVV